MSDSKFRRYCRMRGIKGRQKKRFLRYLKERNKKASAMLASASLPTAGVKSA